MILTAVSAGSLQDKTGDRMGHSPSGDRRSAQARRGDKTGVKRDIQTASTGGRAPSFGC